MRRHRSPVLLLLAACLACVACRGEATRSRRARVPIGAVYDEGPPPEIVATMTCLRMMRWHFPDGTVSRGPNETLVVRNDGAVELHDVDAQGPLMSETRIAADQVARLTVHVVAPAWSELVYERGSPFPDGAVCEIKANHRRVKRFDSPEDEPIVKAVWADLQAIWAQAERSPWRGSLHVDPPAAGDGDAAARD